MKQEKEIPWYRMPCGEGLALVLNDDQCKEAEHEISDAAEQIVVTEGMANNVQCIHCGRYLKQNPELAFEMQFFGGAMPL